MPSFNYVLFIEWNLFIYHRMIECLNMQLYLSLKKQFKLTIKIIRCIKNIVKLKLNYNLIEQFNGVIDYQKLFMEIIILFDQ